MADTSCDVLIVGASLGGVAAALRAGAIGAFSLARPAMGRERVFIGRTVVPPLAAVKSML